MTTGKKNASICGKFIETDRLLNFSSDLKIKLSSDEEIFAHKFILSARNKGWGLLESGSVLGKSYLNI